MIATTGSRATAASVMGSPVSAATTVPRIIAPGVVDVCCAGRVDPVAASTAMQSTRVAVAMPVMAHSVTPSERRDESVMVSSLGATILNRVSPKLGGV